MTHLLFIYYIISEKIIVLRDFFLLSCQLFGLLTLSLQQQELFAPMMTLSAIHWSLLQNLPPSLILCVSLLCVREYMVGVQRLGPTNLVGAIGITPLQQGFSSCKHSVEKKEKRIGSQIAFHRPKHHRIQFCL